jgi:CHAT domain-containing protein
LLDPTGHRRNHGGLLAVGGADFDASPATSITELPTGVDVAENLEAPDHPIYRGPAPACSGFEAVHFDRLPGTLQETREAAAVWARVFGDAEAGVTHLSGRSAHETLVKRMAPGRSVVHLATHGFFLGGECTTESDGRPGAVAPETAMNALLLSGLALSGANQRGDAPAGLDDGILTAEEIAALDLGGVEWVVLSACDTATGTVLPGEGLFGLRRAFEIAGARTLIMSLWSVEDQTARLWVTALYRNRFEKGMSTMEAAHRTSLELLAARRAAGRSTHPFHWGAFVATGDWR